ncbi:hypothetical protein T4C_9057, partial [Trichinella pseudospiralis]
MVHTYMVKLMKQKKVKMRMTRNKSRWALRRTRDEKSLSSPREGSNALKTDMNNEEKKRRKRGRHKAYHRHTKQIADDTKQYKGRQEVYAVPRGSQFCKSGLGILRKGEVIP